MKNLLSKPHMIFSVENPKHDTGLKISHEEFLKKLQNAGVKAHHLGGHYGSPENSILIEEPDDNIKNSILNIAGKQGQESVLFSDGKNHELQYISGPEKGRVVRGSGTNFHANKPEDFYSTLPNGEHFTHNLDFDKSEQEKQEQASDQQELEPLKKPYASDAQRRWAHTKAGVKALGGEAKVREWDKESKGKDLPERVAKSKCESCGTDLIPGGLADKKSNKDFPKKQLDMGRKVEMEHTKNPKVAEEIARDHLTEDKAYYDKLKTIESKHKMEKRCWEGCKPVPGKKPYSKGSCAPVEKKEEKPFHGYNPKKHARTGGLNDKERKRINREEGRDLKRPQPEGGPRKRSFCARFKGMRGPTSKDGKLTRKGAALRRWKCSEKEEKFQSLMKSYRDYFKKKLG